jgi:hypothetical protein
MVVEIQATYPGHFKFPLPFKHTRISGSGKETVEAVVSVCLYVFWLLILDIS